MRLLTSLVVASALSGPWILAEEVTPYKKGPTSPYPVYKKLAGDSSYQRETDSTRDTYQPEYVTNGSYRQPTSLVVIDDKQAMVATKLTGEIHCLDLATLKSRVVLTAADRQFGDLTKVDAQRVIATDTRNDEIVLLQRNADSEEWTQRASAKVPGRPDSVSIDVSKKQLWVSSVWAQRLYKIELSEEKGTELRASQFIDLPMCGGEVVSLPKQDAVLVLDAFGTHFCVVNPQTDRIVHHGQLHEHNLVDAHLLEDGDQIIFPQQLLIDLVSAVQGQITWGNVLSNNLRIMETNQLMAGSNEDAYRRSEFIPIGSVGNGAGDPTSLAIHGDQLAVTIGGTHQVALGRRHSRDFKFVDVGYRPIDCEFTESGTQLLVANQFSDSLSVIDVQSHKVTDVKLGNLRPPTEVERGEQLFHDSRLAHDGWMSCQSCHTDGHTNGLLSDNFTDGTYDSPKRVLSLLGQAETMPYGWTGSIQTLEEQVEFSIHSTMAADHSASPLDIDRIAKYVRTLERPPSVVAARSEGELDAAVAQQIQRGREFFTSAGCIDCHQAPHFTSSEAYDVELRDEQGTLEFNPPSLEGIGQRQNSLFHDGRARSIADVIFKQKHQMPSNASDQQRRDLEIFLLSL